MPGGRDWLIVCILASTAAERRERRRGRVDLNLVVGDVRDRIDRQPGEGVPTDGRRDEGEENDQPAVMNRQLKNPRDHLPTSQCAWDASALPSSALSVNVLMTAISSPASRPKTISLERASLRPITTSRFSNPLGTRTKTT